MHIPVHNPQYILVDIPHITVLFGVVVITVHVITHIATATSIPVRVAVFHVPNVLQTQLSFEGITLKHMNKWF